MIGWRLSNFKGRSQATTTIKTIAGAVVYANLKADHQQIEAKEAAGPLGEMATVVHDVFIYGPINGELPVILEKHIVHWNGKKYKIVSAQALDELAHKLRVETKFDR